MLVLGHDATNVGIIGMMYPDGVGFGGGGGGSGSGGGVSSIPGEGY